MARKIREVRGAVVQVDDDSYRMLRAEARAWNEAVPGSNSTWHDVLQGEVDNALDALREQRVQRARAQRKKGA